MSSASYLRQMPGIIRALREIFRQTRTFGDAVGIAVSVLVCSPCMCMCLGSCIRGPPDLTCPEQELAQIRASAVELKSEVDLIRIAREKSQQQTEQLALSKLRQTLQAYQAEGETIQLQKAAVSHAWLLHAVPSGRARPCSILAPPNA